MLAMWTGNILLVVQEKSLSVAIVTFQGVGGESIATVMITPYEY